MACRVRRSCPLAPAGCNLTCSFCQNLDISKARDFDDARSRSAAHTYLFITGFNVSVSRISVSSSNTNFIRDNRLWRDQRRRLAAAAFSMSPYGGSPDRSIQAAA